MLAEVLTAYAEFVGDRLVNVCGQAVPGRVLRYHGHAPPEDLDCSGNGYLAVWWEGPALVPKDPRSPCPGPLPVTLAAKYVVCWPIAEVDASGITLFDDGWDALAATLADVAECIAGTLAGLTCDDSPPSDADEFEVALLGAVRQPRFLGVTPTGAGGGSAGLVWRLQVVLGTASTS